MTAADGLKKSVAVSSSVFVHLDRSSRLVFPHLPNDRGAQIRRAPKTPNLFTQRIFLTNKSSFKYEFLLKFLYGRSN